MANEQSLLATEERILRLWTPILLRSILALALALLGVGVIRLALQPGGYAAAWQANTDNPRRVAVVMSIVVSQAGQGQPLALITVGLLALTLVPLVRVAFCLLIFVRERDPLFVLFTAYVFASLIFGIIVGRIG